MSERYVLTVKGKEKLAAMEAAGSASNIEEAALYPLLEGVRKWEPTPEYVRSSEGVTPEMADDILHSFDSLVDEGYVTRAPDVVDLGIQSRVEHMYEPQVSDRFISNEPSWVKDRGGIVEQYTTDKDTVHVESGFPGGQYSYSITPEGLDVLDKLERRLPDAFDVGDPEQLKRLVLKIVHSFNLDVDNIILTVAHGLNVEPTTQLGQVVIGALQNAEKRGWVV